MLFTSSSCCNAGSAVCCGSESGADTMADSFAKAVLEAEEVEHHHQLGADDADEREPEEGRSALSVGLEGTHDAHEDVDHRDADAGEDDDVDDPADRGKWERQGEEPV